MKVKFQIFLAIISFMMLIASSVIVSVRPKEEPKQQPEKLVITIPKQSTEGKITIYDNNGVRFQYEGEGFNIINNGKDGENIEIIIQMPFEGDSCFDEEGNLIKEGVTDEQ